MWHQASYAETIAVVTQGSVGLVQNKFDWQDAHLEGEGARKLISYGPCQFPTLGLIVQRAW